MNVKLQNFVREAKKYCDLNGLVVDAVFEGRTRCRVHVELPGADVSDQDMAEAEPGAVDQILAFRERVLKELGLPNAAINLSHHERVVALLRETNKLIDEWAEYEDVVEGEDENDEE